MKKVDILLATYNGERYLKEQLESIINQTYINWKLYISDDGSTDKTRQIIQEYKNRDARIVEVPFKKNGGARNNFFYLMRHATSDFIMCADQDDVWLPNKVETAINAISSVVNQDIPILLYSDLIVVDEELAEINASYFNYQNIFPDNEFKNLLVQNCVTGCTMIFNKKLCELAMQCKNIDCVIMHDWWLALIAAAFGKIEMIDHKLIYYRQHENNSIGAKKGTGIGYFINKISHISSIRKAILNTQGQAKVFYDTFYNRKLVDDKVLELSKEYGHLYQKNKIIRLKYYYRNHIKKSGFIRTLGFYILG